MSGYIVPSDLLKTNPPTGCKQWHATEMPADSTQSLLVVEWDDFSAQDSFEALPGVVLLVPSEAMGVDAAPLLESLNDPAKVADQSAKTPAVVEGAPVVPETVGTALKKIAWPGARMI